MPAGNRVRANNAFGTVDDNPLLIGAGAFNSSELVLLPTIAAAHAIVTLDPLRQFGDPEIVVVTVHTASATVATITRGQYGTVARQHPQGTVWTHAALDEDFTEILTSGTRPTNPYLGQLIFEADLDQYVYRNAANTDWVALLGAWAPWTPVFTNFTLGNGTIDAARFTRIGRTIHWVVKVTLGSTSAMGSLPTISLPVNASATGVSNILGHMTISDLNVGTYPAIARYDTAGTSRFLYWNVPSTGVPPRLANVSATAPMTWVVGDHFTIIGTYEAAS